MSLMVKMPIIQKQNTQWVPQKKLSENDIGKH